VPWEAKLAEYGVLGIVVYVCFRAILWLNKRVEGHHEECKKENQDLRNKIDQQAKEYSDKIDQQAKEYSDRVESLHQRVETLHKERVEQAERTIALMVEVTKKSEESKYAVISAVTESNQSAIRVEQTLNAVASQTGEAIQKFLQLSRDPHGDRSSGG